MEIRGRTFLAAIVACTLPLLFTAESIPSTSNEAGHMYSVAQERLADLRKSHKRKKYRSYWTDVIRSFQSVERTYPSSPQAADACFDRSSVYLDLYNYNRVRKDADKAAAEYLKCQSAFPQHERAAEALYWNVVVAKTVRGNKSAALEVFKKMVAAYPDSAWTDKARRRLGIGTAAKQNRTVAKKAAETEIRKMPETVIEASSPQKEPGVVQGIRFWSGDAYTRVVIDQDRNLKFQAQELKNPDRLVFDLLNSRISDSLGRDPVKVNDGILKQVRVGQYAPDVVRVVLDLASLKSYGAFPMHDPERLVIDITGNSSGGDDDTDPHPAASQQKQPVASASAAAAPRQMPQLPRKDPKAAPEDSVSLSRQLGLKIRKIAIDAGHGGYDPGAIGKSGLKEKTITLDVAKRLAALVKERLGCDVVMTRDTDVFIPLEERPAIARKNGADLFVSIHVNSNRKKRARGIETYYQSLRASDRDAMATAARENAMSTKKLSELKSELDRIFADLAKDDKLEESLQLAHTIQTSLVDTMKPVQGHVVNLGVKRAFFYVLVKTDMPSILAEVGFISNPDEEKQLKKDSYRQKIAEALFEGVKKYVESRGQQVAGM